MQKRFGGDGPAVLQPYAINDYGTGLMGAYGVALALLHRQKTGEGQHVQTALARTACTLQSQFMQEYEGKQCEEPRGQDALGWGPLHRLYRASDGWFFLALREDQHDRLAAAPGLEAVSNRASDALEPALERAFVQDTAEAWVERLRAVGVGAQRALSAEDVMADAYAVSRGLSLTREHDGVGLVTTNGPSPLLSRTPVVPGRPAPVPGADALSVLADIGREDEIDALVAAGAIRLPETANPPA
jgi:crotonobetainyl-CoA:carnitine CoA-transferase CaiB-like acyl-CoA transferase